MSCLGVLFAVDETAVRALNETKREDRPAAISDELEEDYFEHHRDCVCELDKAWDAIHRLFCESRLEFGEAYYPLSGVVLGGEVLYGNLDGEEDYVITLKHPSQVAAIAKALADFGEEDCRKAYYAIDETLYGFPPSEEDFEYTWSYLSSCYEFFHRAAEKGFSILFTVDQ